MNPTNHIQPRILPSCLILALALIAQSAGAVSMSMTVTDLGGSFRYDVSIHNNETEDLAIVSINDAPLADPLIDPTLVTPAGFLGSYDDGLGFVDFIEGVNNFAAGTTVGGFRFESLTGPGTYFTTFEALSVFGNLFNGSINVTVNQIPETGSTLRLAGLGFMALALARKRLAAVNSQSTEA
jgi:hypothetical protein